MDKNNIIVPALDRGLHILEYLVYHQEGATLKEVSSHLNIPSSSAFRLLKNLAARGYVHEKNNGQLIYTPGSTLLRLLNSYKPDEELFRYAKPVIKSLSAQTGQTTQLGVLEDGFVVYKLQSLPPTPVSIIAPLHTPVPINISASGKILAANLSDKRLNNLVKNMSFIHKTANSILTAEAFKEELKKVKKNQYAIDNEEYAPGIGCMAAPVFDYRGKCVAALGITGHITDYIEPVKRKLIIEETVTAAKELSILNGQPMY